MFVENEIPLSLISEFKKNNVVLFLGAGASINAGLPSWSELLKLLVQRFLPKDGERFDFFQQCDHLEKAQYLYDISDKISVINAIKEIFDTPLTNFDLHNKIASLPVNTIITTNWDCLIENAFERKGINLTKIWKDDQISSATLGGKNIIKFHGTIEDPESIVFSEDDYQTSFHRTPLIKQYLSAILSRSTILMVGYSYRDINFKAIRSFVNKYLGTNSRKIYTLLLNSSRHRSDYLKNRNLLCINFKNKDDNVAMLNFIEKLNNAVSVYADNPEQRLKIMKRENEEIANGFNGLILRNMAALGPLGTPIKADNDELFGENTLLEIKCANNWKTILDKEKSTAKIILCLNEIKAKSVFSKLGYSQRIKTLISNLGKYKEKIDVVDSGSPLIMSNFDIYGDIVFLENLKTNVNNFGYSHIRVHRDKTSIKANIEIFDKMFESIKALNIAEAKEYFDGDETEQDLVHRLIIERLHQLANKVERDW